MRGEAVKMSSRTNESETNPDSISFDALLTFNIWLADDYLRAQFILSVNEPTDLRGGMIYERHLRNKQSSNYDDFAQCGFKRRLWVECFALWNPKKKPISPQPLFMWRCYSSLWGFTGRMSFGKKQQQLRRRTACAINVRFSLSDNGLST